MSLSEEEKNELKSKIDAKGAEIRELKGKKDDALKGDVAVAVAQLLALKQKYKESTGGEEYPVPPPPKNDKKVVLKNKEAPEVEEVKDPNKKNKKQLNKEKKKAAKKQSKDHAEDSTVAATGLTESDSSAHPTHPNCKKNASVVTATTFASTTDAKLVKKDEAAKKMKTTEAVKMLAPSFTDVNEPQIQFSVSNVPFVSCILAKLLGSESTLLKQVADVGALPTLLLPEEKKFICGDHAIARYLVKTSTSLSGLYGFDDVSTASIDSWLDYALSNIKSETLPKTSAFLNEYVKDRTYLEGPYALTLADMAIWTALQKLKFESNEKLLPYLTRWYNHMGSLSPFLDTQRYIETLKPLPSLNNKQKQKQEQEQTSPVHPGKNESSRGNKTESHRHGGGELGSCPPLEGAVDGQVVTRFPPEPSGYLHIGHVKACMLNNYYARRYNGKLIVRFDDTNPSKEKEEFQQSILEDLTMLGIHPDIVSHTSDHFDKITELARKMIQDGNAYMDNTVQEVMRQERMDGIESSLRNASVETNLQLFEWMIAGDKEKSDGYCLRAKMDMQAKNKTLRDPVLFRANATPHHRTGFKYKAYPTYDFACPIVDSLEGVTTALRTTEYNDRDEQYQWIIQALQLRPVKIHSFGRMNFVYSVLSKRKLQWFVDQGLVTGWNDARFPTVRGVLRRGVQKEALQEFILSQGASRRIIDMEWDKFWSVNKRIIDPMAPRFFAMDKKSCVSLKLENIASSTEASDAFTGMSVPLHPKRADMGNKVMRFGKHLLIEKDDADALVNGEEITLMRYGNVIINQVTKDADGITLAVVGTANPTGDFKKTKKKITWLPDMEDLVPVTMVEFDFLITKAKLEEGDKFEDYVNPVTRAETLGIGEHAMRNLQENDVIQLERRGYFRVDQPFISEAKPLILFMIPDGKAKAMSTLSTKLAHR